MAEIRPDDEGIWQVCPDFVVEVRSPSDQLTPLQEKMDMWVSQGARVAWLVDPYEAGVWIYRPDQPPEHVARPESLAASEIAEDLVIDFRRIWLTQDQADATE